MNPAKPPEFRPDELAGLCLRHLSADPDRLARFMADVGLSPDQLRQAVAGGEIAGGLIDWFAHNESALVALCEDAGMTTEHFMRAYYRLNPGG